jgi:enamine deaminase RidA (YjgF/YER057c/UK114 family)
MSATHLEHVDGIADVPGIAVVSIGTGSRHVYVSGQVGQLSDGSFVEGGLRAQAAQAMRNLQTALAAAGATMRDVVKLTFLVVDWEPQKVGELFEASIEVFGDDIVPTASTLHGVAALFDPAMLIEIDAVAIVD